MNVQRDSNARQYVPTATTRRNGLATALAAGLTTLVLGNTAFAQATSVPVANQPKQCQELARKGFTIRSETIMRSGTSSAPVAAQARPGSYGPTRKYGEGGNNKWFIDSFPSHPKEGCRICGVWVTVKGTVNPNNLNNDSVSVVGANSTGPQIQGNPLAFNSVHTKLTGSTAPLPQGSYSAGFMVEGPAFMNWYLGSANPYLDVMVQDDTVVDAVSVTYFYY